MRQHLPCLSSFVQRGFRQLREDGRCFFDIHVFLPSGLLPPDVFGAAEGLGKAVEGFALGNGDGVVDTAIAGVVVDVLSLALELALFEGHDIDVAVAKEGGY